MMNYRTKMNQSSAALEQCELAQQYVNQIKVYYMLSKHP